MKRKVGFALLNNVVMAFFPLALIALVSKHVEMGDFGKLTLWISMVALFSGVADLGFATSMVSDYNTRGQNCINAIVTSYNQSFYRWLILFSFGLAFSLILLKNKMGFDTIEAAYLWGTTILITTHKYLTSQYMACGKVYKLFINTLVVTFVRLAGIFLVILKTHGSVKPIAILPIYLAGPAIGLLIMFFDPEVLCSWSRRLPSDSHSHLRKVAWIGLSNTIILARTRGDLALASLFFPQTQIAIYSVANILAGGVNLFTVAIIDNYIPIIGRKNQRDGLRMLSRHLILTLPVAVVLCLVGWVLAPFVVRIVAGPRYLPSIPILRILLICSLGALAFVPLEAFLYVYQPSRVFAIKIWQLILFSGSLFVLAPRYPINIMGTIGLVPAVGGWILCIYFLHRNWITQKNRTVLPSG